MTLILGISALILLYATVQAKRLGNEKRDIALLGACCGLCGVGTAATAVL
jgi:hypothetical protein